MLSEKIYKILIIEDDPEDAYYLIELLESIELARFEIVSKSTLNDGLTVLKKESFDIILSDLNLPDSSSSETLNSLFSSIPDIPVIVLTGLNNLETGIKAVELGAQDYLVKGNFDKNKLQSSIIYAISRKKLEENLKSSNSLLFDIFNDTPLIMFLVNSKREIVRINKSGVEIAKKSEKDIIGLKIGNAFRCINAIEDKVECGTTKSCGKCVFRLTVQDTFIRKSGLKNVRTELYQVNEERERRDMIISTSYIDSHTEPLTLVSFNDITDIENSKREIQKNNERLERLQEISDYKPDSNEELLGFALKEAINLTESELGFICLPNEGKKDTIVSNDSSKNDQKSINKQETIYDINKIEFCQEVIRKRESLIINDFKIKYQSEEENLFKGVKLNRLMYIPVIEKSKIVATVCLANKNLDYNNSDMSQLALMMNTVVKIVDKYRSKQELIQAKEKAEESNRLKSAFLASISHEIRTPLNAIIGFSSMIAETTGDSETIEFSRMIEDSNDVLLKMMDDLIDFAKITSGSLDIHKKEFDLIKPIKSLIKIFNTKCTDQVNLITNIHHEKLIINSDENRINQVFLNLISNAIKFTKSGTISFGYNISDNNEVICFVSDTGIGIPTDKQEEIFDRFIKLDPYIQGIGMGLSIVKRLVQLMGGRIWLESEQNIGSTFYFSLPVDINEESKTEMKANEIQKKTLLNK